MMTEHLKIDEEFRTIIPPLSAEEYANLERSLRSEGCRDAITVWDGVIVDGHNRYEICTKWGISFNINHISFSSRDAAISWICLNQLSRRNLTKEAYKYLIGKRYDAEKAIIRNTEGKNQYSADNSQGDSAAQKTSKRLAIEYNLTHSTVERYGQFSRSLDKIESEKPGTLPTLLSGKCRITEKNISALANLPENKIKKVVDTLNSYQQPGEAVPLKTTAKVIKAQKDQERKDQLTTKIKELPEYNPDSEINGLMLTVPTWTDMLNRIRGVPVRYASEKAKAEMHIVLNELQQAIYELRREMEGKE